MLAFEMTPRSSGLKVQLPWDAGCEIVVAGGSFFLGTDADGARYHQGPAQQGRPHYSTHAIRFLLTHELNSLCLFGPNSPLDLTTAREGPRMHSDLHEQGAVPDPNNGQVALQAA